MGQGSGIGYLSRARWIELEVQYRSCSRCWWLCESSSGLWDVGGYPTPTFWPKFLGGLGLGVDLGRLTEDKVVILKGPGYEGFCRG